MNAEFPKLSVPISTYKNNQHSKYLSQDPVFKYPQDNMNGFVFICYFLLCIKHYNRYQKIIFHNALKNHSYVLKGFIQLDCDTKMILWLT